MTDNYTDGLTVRRQVMGDEFVEQALDNATEFTKPLQDFITRNAWGSVWCRGGIDLKTRSLITIAMLTALGRQHELRGHVRGAQQRRIRGGNSGDPPARSRILRCAVGSRRLSVCRARAFRKSDVRV